MTLQASKSREGHVYVLTLPSVGVYKNWRYRLRSAEAYKRNQFV
ncbi:MAG: hypothetical protein ACJAU3_001027 [Zhongshania sp.]|jgi:hypothetical protein